MMDLPSSYKLWLQSKNYSASTIRNYLVDVNKYLNFSSFSLLEIDLQRYILSVSSDPNYSRYLSSLSKFFDFAVDQSLIKNNPLKNGLKSDNRSSISIENLISQYKQYLGLKHKSLVTIKNYINDIQQYNNWLQNQPDGLK